MSLFPLQMSKWFLKSSYSEQSKFPWSFSIRSYCSKKTSWKSQNSKTAYVQGRLLKWQILVCSTLWCNSVDKHRLHRRSTSLPLRPHKQCLHCFPSDPNIRKEWINFQVGKGKVPDRISKNSVLCSIHFTVDLFTNKVQRVFFFF